MANFVWGAGGARMTPDEIAAERKVAQALMAQGMDYSPVQSWTQGAARVAQAMMGGLDYRMAGEAAKRNATADQELLAALLGGGGGAPAAQAPAAGPAAPSGVPMASTSGKVYANDELSPLDPPSGADRDMLVRTVLAEAGNQGQVGQQAVANVIRNRAVNGNFGGDTVPGVIQKPYQFEPHNTAGGRAKMAAIDPNSPAYAQAGQAVDAAYTGQDPTGGATHFYAPRTQAALGRSAPAWDNGRGVDIGDHRFFGGAGGPAVTAGMSPSDVSAQTRPGIPGSGPATAPAAAPAAAGMNPAIIQAITSPYASDGVRNIAKLMYQQQVKQADYDIQQRPDGTVIAVNKKNPSDMRVLDAPGAGAAAIQFEADKAAAVAKAKGEAEKAVGADTREKQEKQVANVVVQDIDRAVSLIDRSPFTTTGTVGPLMARIGGTDANNVRALVDTVKANAGFAELQKMRNNSPTGGALGNVSEREIAYLQATIGNMEQSQTAEQFKDNLQRVKNAYLDIIHGEGKGPDRAKLGFQQGAKPSGKTKSGVTWSVQ